jgi:hypothetical protein
MALLHGVNQDILNHSRFRCFTAVRVCASWIQYKEPYHFPYYTSTLEYFPIQWLYPLIMVYPSGIRHFPFSLGIALRFGLVWHNAFISRAQLAKNMQTIRNAETSETIYQSTRHMHSRRLKSSVKQLEEPRNSQHVSDVTHVYDIWFFKSSRGVNCYCGLLVYDTLWFGKCSHCATVQHVSRIRSAYKSDTSCWTI